MFKKKCPNCFTKITINKENEKFKFSIDQTDKIYIIKWFFHNSVFPILTKIHCKTNKNDKENWSDLIEKYVNAMSYSIHDIENITDTYKTEHEADIFIEGFISASEESWETNFSIHVTQQEALDFIKCPRCIDYNLDKLEVNDPLPVKCTCKKKRKKI